jgi:GntR family transcriptional regulator
MPAAPEVPVPSEIETLDLTLDRSSYMPYDRQVRDQIKSIIRAGKLKPGQTISSDGTFAEKFGISNLTVHQTFQALRGVNLTIIEKARRPTVRTGRIQKSFHKLRGFATETTQRGLKPSFKVPKIERVLSDAATANLLRLSHGQQACRNQRLRDANKEVVRVGTVILPTCLFPDLDKQDRENQFLCALMQNGEVVSLLWSEEGLEVAPRAKARSNAASSLRSFPFFSSWGGSCTTRTTSQSNACTLFFEGIDTPWA